MKPIVLIESPYAGDIDTNLRYLRAAMRDSIMRAEAPFASHALYTQPGVLRDDVPTERELGISLNDPFRAHAKRVAVYCDLGISDGMKRGIDQANGTQVVYRYLRCRDVSPALAPVMRMARRIHWKSLPGLLRCTACEGGGCSMCENEGFILPLYDEHPGGGGEVKTSNIQGVRPYGGDEQTEHLERIGRERAVIEAAREVIAAGDWLDVKDAKPAFWKAVHKLMEAVEALEEVEHD